MGIDLGGGWSAALLSWGGVGWGGGGVCGGGGVWGWGGGNVRVCGCGGEGMAATSFQPPVNSTS